jgi:hypothetical protein
MPDDELDHHGAEDADHDSPDLTYQPSKHTARTTVVVSHDFSFTRKVGDGT